MDMEYALDVYSWKCKQQRSFFVFHPLSAQSHITPAMRLTVLKWLLEVNRQFNYQLETWCLTVNILDRFLAVQPLHHDNLQLASLTAFFVAAKLEEVDPPEIPELINLCANTYERSQFKYMEFLLLSQLDFKLSAPTPLFFLNYLV